MSIAWVVAFVALCVVVLVIGALVLGVLRRITPLLEEMESRFASLAVGGVPGLKPGSQLPRFTAKTTDGSKVGSPDLLGSPLVFVFLNSNCRPCETLAAELRSTSSFDPDVPLIVVLDFPDGQQLAEGLPYRVLFQRRRSVSKSFGVVGTPHAFAVDATGTVVASEITNSVAQLEVLAGRAKEGGAHRTKAAVQLVS
ncbi:MAG: redoxin domain-containing protein [Gaiellaceae bacterium]